MTDRFVTCPKYPVGEAVKKSRSERSSCRASTSEPLIFKERSPSNGPGIFWQARVDDAKAEFTTQANPTGQLATPTKVEDAIEGAVYELPPPPPPPPPPPEYITGAPPPEEESLLDEDGQALVTKLESPVVVVPAELIAYAA